MFILDEHVISNLYLRKEDAFYTSTVSFIIGSILSLTQERGGAPYNLWHCILHEYSMNY